MHRSQQQVQEFHREVLSGPTSPAEPKLRNPALRARMLIEEAFETAIALVGLPAAQGIAHEQILAVSLEKTKAAKTEPDVAEAIDGLCDTIVIAYGSAEDIGVDLEPFFDEVHRSNMAKKDGPVREDGKRLKPPGWTPPDIEGVLRQMLEDREYELQLERESPPTLDALTPEQYRAMTPHQRGLYHYYWARRGIASFRCIGCGFPTAHGVAVCDACGDHPEIRFGGGK